MLFFPSQTLAASVHFSEVGWMGTDASAYDEWLEILNSSSTEIDLKDWKVFFNGEEVVSLSGKIGAGKYYLIERGDDLVISNLAASEAPKKWSVSLVNNGGELELRNSTGEVVDKVSCSQKWCAGSSNPKKSMQLSSNKEWITSSEVGSGIDRSGNPILGNPLAGLSSNQPNLVIEDVVPTIGLKMLSRDHHLLFLVLTLDNSKDRSFRVKLIGDVLLWSEEKLKWLHSTDAWNDFPIAENNLTIKAYIFPINETQLKAELRDTKTLKIFTSKETIVPKDSIVESSFAEATGSGLMLEATSGVLPKSESNYSEPIEDSKFGIDALETSPKVPIELLVLISAGFLGFSVWGLLMLKSRYAARNSS